MENMKPDYLSLNGLLSDRLFRIPEYQRPYSWEKKQRDDLFEDIRKAFDKETNHFMATIVCLKTNDKEQIGADEFFIYDIVDGQQRLTTLIILLKAIQLEFNKHTKEEKNVSEKLYHDILVRGSKQLVLLQTNHDEAKAFELYLKKGKKPEKDDKTILPVKNLYDAFNQCELFVKEWKKENDLIQLLFVIKNRIGFLVYELTKEQTVYTVFEVLNSRGLPVIYLDKAKSLFMSLAFEKFNDQPANLASYTGHIKSTWSDIYKFIGLNEYKSEDIIKYAGTFISETKGKLLSSDESLKLFEEKILKQSDDIKELNTLLYRVAQYMRELYDNPYYKFFSEITQLRFFYIAVRMNSALNDNQKKEVLRCWEKVSFKIYGLFHLYSKKKEALFIRLGREVWRGEISNIYSDEDEQKQKFNAMSLCEKIIDRLNFIGDDEDIEKIIDELEESDCYTDWQDELKYLFFKIEEFLFTEKTGVKASFDIAKWKDIFDSSSAETIEHIFPQTIGTNWAGKLGKGNKHEKMVNRLGNLLVLPKSLNSQASNKAFKDKKDIYKNALLNTANDIVYINYLNDSKTERNDWNLDEIIKREDKLLKMIKQIWG